MEIRTILEERVTTPHEAPPHASDVLVHAGWREAWSWLVQGTTTRPADFALSGVDPVGAWTRLVSAVGCTGAVHARQPHGSTVGVRGPIHRPGGPGLHPVGDADGHLTRVPGVLLGVTTADCVPITLVEATRRIVGVVHAGWRGASAGILERALDRMSTSFGVRPDDLHLHLGPAICGDCYEVGPEVHEALGLERPPGPTPVDLPQVLARRAVRAGARPDRITRSGWCTLCAGREVLYSHRGGDSGRQVGFVAIAPHVDGR